MIVDAEGYIITNYHVVDRASEVNVELSDGSKHRAQVVGIDPATDLAVLKIDAANLTAAPWGKSSDMEVGDPVLAIGNPFGLARTVTAGILSATGRHAVVERVNYQDFLQTDAAVNPGNSGGPLVNMRGQIVGINTAIVGPTYQGISFAIPSDMVHQVYDQLIKSGKVARGWLGVSMRELTAEESERLGVKRRHGIQRYSRLARGRGRHPGWRHHHEVEREARQRSGRVGSAGCLVEDRREGQRDGQARRQGAGVHRHRGPAAGEAAVTPLQAPRETLRWASGGEGKVQADAAGCITTPRPKIAAKAATLSVGKAISTPPASSP